MKRAIFILIACGLVFIATRKIVLLLQSTPQQQQIAASAPPPILPEKPESVVTSLPPLTNLTLRTQRPSSQKIAPQSESLPQTNSHQIASPAPQKKNSKPPRQDPVARVALSLVGIDSTAEEYWAMAINDASLSESEREDLIEDLNEEGFEDPKNPSIDELPLIINRLQIIEEYAPSAMDDVNARSFAEAYKDLVNMYVRLTGEQPP